MANFSVIQQFLVGKIRGMKVVTAESSVFSLFKNVPMFKLYKKILSVPHLKSFLNIPYWGRGNFVKENFEFMKFL